MIEILSGIGLAFILFVIIGISILLAVHQSK
ncbi:hypothetical protein BN1048_01190 [Jeotgalicoccus saudimassiliensis]|uniref:Uncharacterized protein n=1 Tax=Jeotgalicoccus saudimassiliensis TaxID=1461582 RepID=A0A078M6I3_9STAP|nr:hypothetical protein BN1048_01190 [Jeotgalicoccus saudimassiliensis]